MKALDHSFLSLGRSGKFHWTYYFISLTGLFLIILFSSVVFPYLISEWASKFNSTNFQLFMDLIPFLLILILFLKFASLIHKRPILSFISSHNTFQIKKTIIAGGAFLILNLLMELINYKFLNQSYSWTFNSGHFFYLVLLSCLLFPVQAATEEIMVRGYLMQALSAVFQLKPLIIIMISSLTFALLHLNNPEFSTYATFNLILIYFVSSIFFALFALLGQGLEIPIGLHSANNLYAAVFVSYESSALQTDSFYKMSAMNLPLMSIEYLLILCLLFLLFLKLKWIEHPINLFRTLQ